MRFHLNYTPPKATFEINHSHSIMLLGSCFSENIGVLLRSSKFDTVSNPDGILFNPKSVANTLLNYIEPKVLSKELIIRRGESYLSYLHHSTISSSSSTELLEKTRYLNETGHLLLKNIHFLFITFGTAFHYHHTELGLTVVNCHKQPSFHFEKKRLSVEDIVSSFSDLILKIQRFNPAIKIIFTVSPVKYLKDGIIENNLSKSTLVLAVHQLVETQKNCYYFPAYELLNDDLRDYRFYKEDLAHPNDLAIDYIWEKFSQHFFNKTTIATNSKILKLSQALAHRPILQNKEEHEIHKKHITQLEEEITADMKSIL